MKLISEEINQYCERYSQPDSNLLKELTEYTYNTEEVPQMVCGIQVGNILQGFIKSLTAKRVLEIGMFTGYSALKMAESLPEEGEIHTCELADNHVKTANSFFILLYWPNI